MTNIDVSRWNAKPVHPDCGRCGRETDTDDDHWFVCRSCHLTYDPHYLTAELTCETGDGRDHSRCAGTGRALCRWCSAFRTAGPICTICGGTGLEPEGGQS